MRRNRANKYCIMCRGRLEYFPTLSNPKALNKYRTLVYACPDCSLYQNKPVMLAIQKEDDDRLIRGYKISTNSSAKSLKKGKLKEKKGWSS